MVCRAPEDRPLSVLVVDDLPDTAESLAVVLSIHGFEVRTARDGVEALETATANPPDVVLTDIGMPRMNGWEFVRQLRERCRDRLPFIIVVSGYGMAEDIRKSTDAGADMHLLKPVRTDELISILGRLRGTPRVAEPKTPG